MITNVAVIKFCAADKSSYLQCSRTQYEDDRLHDGLENYTKS